MQIRYSPEADALYVRLADGYCERTDDLGDLRHVDYASDGKVIGVEFLNPRARGVDLSGVPHAAEIGAELQKLGFQLRQPAA